MRLDKYLKISRIIKRRTVASEACNKERVIVNGNIAKASTKIKVGDVIEIKFGDNILKVEVICIKETTKKEDASNMYKNL